MLRAKCIVQDALPGHVVDTLMQQSPERALPQAADLVPDLPSFAPAGEVQRDLQDQDQHMPGDRAVPTSAFSAFSTPGQGYMGRAGPGSAHGAPWPGVGTPTLRRAASGRRFSQAGNISGPARLEDPHAARMPSPPQSPTASRAPSIGAESVRTEVTVALPVAALARCGSFRAPTQAPAMSVESSRFSFDSEGAAAAAPVGTAGPAPESGGIVLPLQRLSMNWRGPRAQAGSARVSCVEGMLAEQHPHACVLFAGEVSTVSACSHLLAMPCSSPPCGQR